MRISDPFIRRPVGATVLGLMILLLGLMGAFGLQTRQYPEVDETVITVRTIYPGASAELMQGFVSAPVSAAVATAEGVDYVSSLSRPSASVVTVQMQLGQDPDIALTEVMSKVQEVRSRLPAGAEDPAIVKGTGQTFATMYLAVRLAGQGLTAAEVAQAINASNFLAAPGRTRNDLVGYPITVDSTLQTPETFGALPVAGSGGEVVRLRDVARVELAAASTDMAVTFNGQPGTFIGVFPSPTANPLDVSAAVLGELPALQASLPDGMTMELMYGATEQIAASIEEVLATATVALIILLFLGSLRAVSIPLVAIPLSLVGTLFILFLMGYSINLLTLLALVLAIGLVVDDAIIVVENVQRHVEEGLSPMQAAFTAMQELSVAIIAMLTTLFAVFLPLFFTGGLTGALFREFAAALTGAVFLSGVVALTISPMMAARVLPSGGGANRFQRVLNNGFSRLEGWYARVLKSTLRFTPVTAFIVAGLIGVTGFLFLNTSSELAPEEDAGALSRSSTRRPTPRPTTPATM